MKKTLLALALFAFAGSTAFAQDGAGKKATATVSPKSSCPMAAKGSVAGGGGSCCTRGAKIAAAKPAVKAPVVAVAKSL